MKNKLTVLLALIALSSSATVNTSPVITMSYCGGDSITLKFYADGAMFNPSIYHYTVYLGTAQDLTGGIQIGNYVPVKNGYLDKFSSTTLGSITIKLPMVPDTFYIGVGIVNQSGNPTSLCSPSMGQPIIIKDCTVGVGESEVDLSVTIYPNPTTSIINISREAAVSVYNLSGRLVMSDKGDKFDVSGLSNGAYMMRLNIEGILINRKIIITK